MISSVHDRDLANPDSAIRVVENNVAIIVGSMPAFAKFLRLYVAEFSVIRSLRTKLSRAFSSGNSPNSSRLPSAGPIGTIGSPNEPKKAPRPYYEMSDLQPTRTQITVDGDAPHGSSSATINQGGGGITKTIDVVQHSQPGHHSQSVEQLL